MKQKYRCPVSGVEYTCVLRNYIRQFREIHGYSQTTLANKVGVSRNTIASVERGDSVCSAEVAFLICLALDIDFENLFYFETVFFYK